jgi:hypothetical protein
MRTRIFILSLVTFVAPLGAQTKADFSQFVAMGDGLAAGFADFQLREIYQVNSFPALVAKQVGTLFPQPLIQSPGIGYVPGFPILPVRLPNTLQTTVRVAAGPVPVRPDAEGQPPQDVFVFNTSVPNMTVSDAYQRYPSQPLIQKNMQQSTLNMILSFPATVTGPDKPYWTQLKYVEELRPTFVILSLGYSDVLPAAAAGDPAMVTSVASFHTSYAAILAGLKSTFATVLVVNIPDPTDTAFYSTLTQASSILVAPVSTLQGLYNLNPTDEITLPGLMAIAAQLTSGQTGPLPPGSIVSAANVAALKAAVAALNTEIASQASAAGLPVYDVKSLFSSLLANGYVSNGQTLTANFLGGLYSLSGFYPGSTVQAIIANGVLGLINQTYGTNFPLVSVDAINTQDPTHLVSLPALRPASNAKGNITR